MIRDTQNNVLLSNKKVTEERRVAMVGRPTKLEGGVTLV